MRTVVGALGVHGSFPLGDATLSVGDTATLPFVNTNVSYFWVRSSFSPRGPGGPGPPSPGAKDSAGGEISNNQ